MSKASQKPCVSWNGESYTYSQTLKRIQEISKILTPHLGKKSLVLIYLPRSLDEYFITVCLLNMKEIGLNISQEQSPHQVQDLLKIFPINYIVTHKKFLKSIFRSCEAPLIFTINENLVLLKNDFYSPPRLPIPEECAWTLLTSGTSGAPKIVMLSENELIQRAKGEVRDFKLSGEDRILNFLSFSHDLGFNQLLSSLMANACLYIHKYVFLQDLLTQIISDKITGLTSVPNIWRELLKNNLQFDFSESNLKYITVSGGSLSEEELSLLINKVSPNISIYKTYGQTETFRSLICEARNESGTGFPLEDVFLEIDYSDDQEIGELIHYGAGSMLGYLDDQISTRHKFGSTGGVKTGDYFTRKESGSYQFICRKDDMKKISGIRFYPSQIEQIILKNPLVSDCAVFLFSDVAPKEILVALISSQGPINQIEMEHFLSIHLSKLFIPKYFLTLESFPKTHSGKIDRKKLQEIAHNFLCKK